MLFVCAAGAGDRFQSVWDKIQVEEQVRETALTMVSVFFCLQGDAIVPQLEM